MPEYYIAQINIAHMRAPLTDPIMEDFVAQLAPINALADQSPGFVWRLQSESGDATSIRVYDDDSFHFDKFSRRLENDEKFDG
jgi:hypothetical protein